MEGRKRPGSPVNIAYFYLADNEKGLKTEAFQHFWSDDQISCARATASNMDEIG
jgi:sarcosine oxidase delta subunit